MKRLFAKGVLATLALFGTLSLTAQDRIHYTGTELSNPNMHDGALSPVVGVHNIQTMRANRKLQSYLKFCFPTRYQRNRLR